VSIDLAHHIANLKKAAPNKIVADDAMLFLGTHMDKPYLRMLKSCTAGTSCFLYLEPVTTLMQIEMYCQKKGITRILSTSVPLLKKLLNWDKRRAPSLSDYAGSHFWHKDIEIVFLPPLKSLATVTYGKFLTTRFVNKLIKQDTWYKETEFRGFSILDASVEGIAYATFSQKSCFLIAVDIETFKENATIRCVSYTGFFYNDDGTISSVSVVLPMDSEYNLSIMRKWNNLPAPKVLQNGKYDISYFSRYNAPLNNYLYDTAHLFHSWYSELPKDLGFLNAFFIREATYWKDLAETNDLYEYYRYNALDTWGTGNCFLAMVIESPQWALDNYVLEFPLVFPCHLSEMTGIARDMDRMADARQAVVAKQKILQAQLNTILDIEAGHNFNVMGSLNMRSLLDLLGCKDIKNADAKALKKVRFRHPFNARIINLILKIRKYRKLISTYITAGKEFSNYDKTKARILYALNPHGTDTSRLASREHHFWCGLQIQNIPRGPAVKQTFISDQGFLWGEADYAQAESRDTAYISGDATLIDTVENAPDFHIRNAELFFGMAEELVTKAIRQIAKNVNHGSAYNMGWSVLIDTMGEENVSIARKLLKLPAHWSLKRVAEYLLDTFHKTYPDIRGVMYPGVIEEVQLTGMLESGGWQRRCFGNPAKSKPVLNSYIAHKPQCLNAQTLNKAYLQVFRIICLNSKDSKNFKLIAQIHDSILFQYRIGSEHLCGLVKTIMEQPVTVTGYDNIEHTFIVPVDLNMGVKYWSELKE